jgi:hypothetical protein
VTGYLFLLIALQLFGRLLGPELALISRRVFSDVLRQSMFIIQFPLIPTRRTVAQNNIPLYFNNKFRISTTFAHNIFLNKLVQGFDQGRLVKTTINNGSNIIALLLKSGNSSQFEAHELYWI